MRKLLNVPAQAGELRQEIRTALQEAVRAQRAQTQLLITLTAVAVSALLVAVLMVGGASREDANH